MTAPVPTLDSLERSGFVRVEGQVHSHEFRGNALHLTAGTFVNRHFTDCVLVSGRFDDGRTRSEVSIELRVVHDSDEDCLSVLAYQLRAKGDGTAFACTPERRDRAYAVMFRKGR